jgi:hypothetical protein
MPYIARNISGGYKRLLKHEVAPNGTLDLEEVFEGFCKPKKAKKNEEAKYSEWTEDQFPEFLKRVEQDYANDRRSWVLEYTDGPRARRGAMATKESPAKKKAQIEQNVTMREQRQKEAHNTRKQVRRAVEGGMTPKDLAWLPPTEASKKIIDNCSNALALKHAIKLARNIAGQEHVRDLLERRLIELGDRLAV